MSLGDGRGRGQSPQVVCVAAPPSSFAQLSLAALLGPRAVPLKVRSSPLCLFFISGLSLYASLGSLPPGPGEDFSIANRHPRTHIDVSTWGCTLLGWGQSGRKLQSQEQVMPALPLRSPPW